MTLEDSGSGGRSRNDSGSPAEPNGTQLFALPPRPPERPPAAVPCPAVPSPAVPSPAVPSPVAHSSAAASAARAAAARAPAAPSVAVLDTVGVGAADAARATPRPERRTPPARLVNEQTRIFVLPEALLRANGEKSSGENSSEELSRRTATFASPPFSPVPNAKVVARSVAKQTLDASRDAGAPAAQPSRAPRLRAFDDARRRVATWSTAQTLNAPLAEIVEAHARSAEAGAQGTAAAQSGPIEVPARKLRLWSRLFVRSSSPPASLKEPRARSLGFRLAALALLMGTVVCAGTLAGRSIARGVGHESSPAAVSPRAAPPAPKQTAAAPETTSAAAPKALPIPARVGPARERAFPPGERGASPGVTLARQAVDALLAGDRPRALLLYRELSQTAPAHDAYREAVRLLDPAASMAAP